MAEAALTALFRAMRTRALDGSPPWGDRAYLALAPLDTPYPYLIYQLQAGGERNAVKGRDAAFVVVVKVVSDSLTQAHAAFAEVEARWNDAGLYDAPTPLAGGEEWAILTTTQEGAVHLTEIVDGAFVYTVGAQVRIRMEAIEFGHV